MKRHLWSKLVVVAVLPVLAVLVPVSEGSAAGVVHAPFVGVGLSKDKSVNWSGYAASGTTFNSVSAQWTQPTGHCTGATTYSAFWVGLDGFKSETVEQTGSEVDCIGGSPQYYAWYEMYPANSVNFDNVVEPGDQFSASVTADGDSFTLTITDQTQDWTHTVVKSLSSADKSSAEVIAEAPCCTGSGDILTLTDFGSVGFSDAEANGVPIGNLSPVKIDMFKGCQGGACGPNTDKTSKLTDAEDFTVTWKGN